MPYSNGFSKDTANILTALATFKGHLPQGEPTSPVIANLVICNMIREINAFLKPFNITFTSYVDDLAFSSKKCFKRNIPEMLFIIKKHGFFRHIKKFIIELIVAK